MFPRLGRLAVACSGTGLECGEYRRFPFLWRGRGREKKRRQRCLPQSKSVDSDKDGLTAGACIGRQLGTGTPLDRLQDGAPPELLDKSRGAGCEWFLVAGLAGGLFSEPRR